MTLLPPPLLYALSTLQLTNRAPLSILGPEVTRRCHIGRNSHNPIRQFLLQLVIEMQMQIQIQLRLLLLLLLNLPLQNHPYELQLVPPIDQCLSRFSVPLGPNLNLNGVVLPLSLQLQRLLVLPTPSLHIVNLAQL